MAFCLGLDDDDNGEVYFISLFTILLSLGVALLMMKNGWVFDLFLV